MKKHWGTIDDSGKWVVFRVSEERAREAYNGINYGKLVKNIQGDSRYQVVEENLSPHD
ncbi:MAG: hypothetical protein ABEK50_03195 [bacterium]